MRILAIVLLLPLFSFTQNPDPFYGDNNYLTLSGSMRMASGKQPFQPDFYFLPDFTPEAYGISSTTVTIQYPKGSDLIRTSVYNADGLLTSYRVNSYVSEYVYKDTLLVEAIYTSKRHISKTVHTYSGDKRIMTQYFTDGKLTQEMTFIYNGDHCIKSTSVDYTGRKHIYVLNHTLDELTGKITMATYFVDGKLRKKWDYSCNEKGVAANPKVDAVSSYCTYNQENNDGSYSTYVRSIKNGDVYLTQTDFSADSTKIRSMEYLNDTILVRKSDYQGNKIATSHYNKKGKLEYTWENENNDQQHVVAQKLTDKNGKVIYLQEYTYLESGLVASVVYTNSKSRKTTSSYNYTFF